MRQPLVNILSPKLYLGLFIGSLFFPPACFAQTPPDTVKIPLNATVEIQWIAPTDNDIDFYRLYFHNPTGNVINVMTISEWWTADTLQMAQKTISLPAGPGFADLTAVDTSNNESDYSEPVFYEIYDPKPGTPQIYKFRVVK